MQTALDATADLADGFVVCGHNGAGMAEHVALHRAVAGAVLPSGALPLPFLGAAARPGRVPVQLHYATDDPFRQEEWVTGFLDNRDDEPLRSTAQSYDGSAAMSPDRMRRLP